MPAVRGRVPVAGHSSRGSERRAAVRHDISPERGASAVVLAPPSRPPAAGHGLEPLSDRGARAFGDGVQHQVVRQIVSRVGVRQRSRQVRGHVRGHRSGAGLCRRRRFAGAPDGQAVADDYDDDGDETVVGSGRRRHDARARRQV